MIPVVLIHWGQSERYNLPAVVAHDQSFGNTVYVLSDDKRNPVDVNYYVGSAQKFLKSYVHLSGNHAEFEKQCFVRWYALAEFMGQNDLETVLYTDSDVLLFCNAEEQYPEWGKGYSLTLALGTSPATSYFTLNGLMAFLDFVDSIYITRNGVFQEFERIYREMQAQGLPGGICDMTAFRYFKQEVRHHKVGEMTAIRNGRTWDHNINAGDGCRMVDCRKKIILDEDGLPKGFFFGLNEWVRFNALHFQGQAKKYLPEYLR